MTLSVPLSSGTTTTATSSLAAMSANDQLLSYTNDTNEMNESLHNTSGDYIHRRWALQERNEAVVVPIVFGLIFITGLVGNGTLIITVVANKVMRNVPNILIVSLSLGDFFLILVSVPVASFLHTFVNWPFGEFMCKMNEYMQTLSLGVSIFTLTALSADRYVAIVDPMSKLTGRTLRTTTGIAIGIWIVAALLALPEAVVSYIHVHLQGNEKMTFCIARPMDPESTYSRVSVTLRVVIYFILPILTIGFFYVMMARMLIRSSESVPTESKTGAANHRRQIAARKKVARVVLSFVTIFIVCWLPTHIYDMWFYFSADHYNQFWHIFKITAFCLKFINSCVNPFALYFLSGQFRKYYNRYLFCCCRGIRYSSLEPTSTAHNLHSTTRRTSPTNMSMVHSQSMC